MFIIRLSPKNLSWIVSIFIPPMSLTKECVKALFPRIVPDSDLINRIGWHKMDQSSDEQNSGKATNIISDLNHRSWNGRNMILFAAWIKQCMHPNTLCSSFTSRNFPWHFYSLDTLARKWHCSTFISIPVIYSVGSKHPLTPHSNSSLTWPSALKSSNATPSSFVN